MHLTIFHYHLLPGGVTQVITSSCISIFKYCKEITKITLVCGKKENAENVVKVIKSSISEEMRGTKNISLEIIPEIGYLSEQSEPLKKNDIVRKLTTLFGESIWWIHNFQLGKNPVFTNALLKIANEFVDIRMVFQIHDFPESGRYEYVAQLQKYLNHPYYPVRENIRYVVINEHDRKLLIDSGIPSSLVLLLENPVNTKLEPPDYENYRESKHIVDRFFGETEKSYLKGRPIYIYPVRAIRRKNILEAGILVRLLEEPANLLVTLPGVSMAEKQYSDTVEETFTKRLIPGVFASGLKGEANKITFKTQISASKAVVSTSVQEGFGYLFINSLVWQKPLAARHLEIFTERENLFREKDSLFYQALKVPVSKKQRSSLIKLYQEKISNLSGILPRDSIEKLNGETKVFLNKENMDFSYLPVSMQIEFLESLGDGTLVNEIKKMNKEIFAKMGSLGGHLHPVYSDATSLNAFTPETHGKNICKIVKSFTFTYNTSHNKDIQANILSYFANIGSLRLLYD